MPFGRDKRNGAAEVGLHAFPGFDQTLVQRVELIVVLRDVLQPEPLHDGGFEKGGRRVGVVLDHFRRIDAVEEQIETANDGDFVFGPALLDEIDERRRDLEIVPEVLLEDVFDCADRGR